MLPFKKRVLIAGSQPYAMAYGRALRQEGFEFTHAVTARESYVEWTMGDFCAAIILEPEILRSLASPSYTPLHTRVLRPLFYIASDLPPELEGTELPVFPVNSNESERTLIELLRAVLRRMAGYPREHRYGGFGIDATERKISFSGSPLSLPSKQFELLTEFIFSGGKLIEQNHLHDQLWPGKDVDTNRLAVHISLLRRTFRKKQIPMLILNHKGQGYVMKPKSMNPIRRTRNIRGQS